MTLPTPPHPDEETGESVSRDVDLSGRTALVTGATSGIGAELARVLALRGAQVLLGGRDAAKLERVLRDFAATTGEAAAGRCRPALGDFSRMAAVAALAERIAAEAPPLDLLHLNAGIFNLPFALTEEGLERTIASNYLGHFLLVHELARRGRLAATCRIVATQSEAVTRNPFARAAFADLEPERLGALARRLWRWRGSPDSKVFLALMMVEWPRRVAATALAGASFVAADPGPTITANVEQVGRVGRWLFAAGGKRFFRSTDVAAAPLLRAATAPDLPAATLLGRDGEPQRLARRASDPGLASRAWSATERALGLAPFSAD